MARNKVLSTEFTFTTDVSRTITITSDKFSGFNSGNVQKIYNRSQKVLIYSLDKEENITVTGNNIVFSASLPTLNIGDKIHIEMDMGYVGTDIITVESIEGKKIISEALVTRKQNSSYTDSYRAMADDILAITGDVTIVPLQDISERHDMAYEMAQWNNVTTPFRLGLLLHPGVKFVALQGAFKYKLSDGTTPDSAQAFCEIGPNEAGREMKTTKYVIFGFQTPIEGINFATYPYINFNQKVISIYNYGCDMSPFNFSSLGAARIIFDGSVTNPILYNSSRYSLNYNSLAGIGGDIILPPFADGASSTERTISIGTLGGSFAGNYIVFPSNVYNLSINGGISTSTGYKCVKFPKCTNLSLGTIWANMVSIYSLVIDTVTNLNMGQLNNSQGSTFTSIYIAKPLFSCNTSVASLWAYVTIYSHIELENGWNFTVVLNPPIPNLTLVNSLICQRLIDYRADGFNIPTITADGTTTIVGHNTLFTEVHHVGETIYINGVAKVIATNGIIDNNHMLMTTTVLAGTNVSYGMNKTITLASTVKGVSTPIPTGLYTIDIDWLTKLQAKGWTIA